MSNHTAENAQVRLAANVDTQSIEGHDRDCARAIWSQANLGGRLTTIQVEHLLSIGARAGREAALREAAEVVRAMSLPPE